MNAPDPFSPALDDLIAEIENQIDSCPRTGAAENISSFFADRLDLFKRTGQQYLRFFLGKTQFALPLINATQIRYTPDVTPLPNLPRWVLGICNIRGEIISVVNLKSVLGFEQPSTAGSSNSIIIQNKNIATTVLVDKIGGILFEGEQKNQLRRKELKDSKFSSCVHSVFVSGQQTIHLLDVDRLFELIGSFHTA